MNKHSQEKHPGFISLKTKIMVSTVLLSTVMTAFLGGYLVWRSYQSLRQQAEQSQLTLAKTLAWQANVGLSRAFQSLQVLAKRPETVHLEKVPLVRELSLVTDATELVDSFLFLLPNGKVFARSLPELEPENLPPDSFFQENLKRAPELKRSVLVDLYRTKINNRGVVISTSVFDHDKLVGILFGIIYLPNHTIGNLETAKFGKSGYAYMVNKDGIAIVHPDRNKWLQDLSALPPVAALKKNKEGVIQFTDAEGFEYLAAYTTIETTSWGVVVKQLTEECYAPANQMLRFMSLFLAFALLIGLYLSLTLSEKIVQPILELAEKVKRYEKGEWDPEVSFSAEPRDEVGILRRSLDRMALTIQARTQERARAHAGTLRAERKLSEAERLATIGQFSAGLAHELNNPLTVILGAEQMARDAKGDRLRHWLGEIHREGERCRRLVQDLLDFAKPVQLKYGQFDLIDVVKGSWKQTVLGRTEYLLKLDPKSFQVWGDSDRFKQVFINLFKNALEAMPQGGEVRVGFKKTGESVIVILQDGGDGIPKKNIPKLFRPFFTTKPNGTGLGLSIVRSILQAHRGTIRIEPAKPRGTRITLLWPGIQRFKRSSDEK